MQCILPSPRLVKTKWLNIRQSLYSCTHLIIVFLARSPFLLGALTTPMRLPASPQTVVPAALLFPLFPFGGGRGGQQGVVAALPHVGCTTGGPTKLAT